MKEAVEGVESVFLLSAPGPRVPEHDRAMVEAAGAAGVRKIVKLASRRLHLIGETGRMDVARGPT